VNSQVPSKLFCGEGPQIAWGEESAKRSERVCAAPQGESVLNASMMAELIVTKKEIWPQLKEATRNLAGGTRGPGAGGQRLPLAGRYGAEHSTLWFLVRGALSGGVCRLRVAAGIKATSVRKRRRGRSSFKAIRKSGGTGTQMTGWRPRSRMLRHSHSMTAWKPPIRTWPSSRIWVMASKVLRMMEPGH
jgi:hypothetical protein